MEIKFGNISTGPNEIYNNRDKYIGKNVFYNDNLVNIRNISKSIFRVFIDYKTVTGCTYGEYEVSDSDTIRNKMNPNINGTSSLEEFEGINLECNLRIRGQLCVLIKKQYLESDESLSGHLESHAITDLFKSVILDEVVIISNTFGKHRSYIYEDYKVYRIIF